MIILYIFATNDRHFNEVYYFRNRKSSLTQTEKREREIAIRYARENSCSTFSVNYSNLIKIYLGVVVRLFAFVRFYPRNIAFESANSFGLSLKLITSWRTLSTEPALILVSFFLPFSRSIAYYFNLPAIR